MNNRDHLANERTFLAYVRTALAFIAFGFVIARFSLFTREISAFTHIRVPSAHTSTAFGVGMACAGVVLGVYGGWRYAATMNAIRRNESRPMPVAAAMITSAAIAAIGVIVAVALFEVR
jgi:putative membrane protein